MMMIDSDQKLPLQSPKWQQQEGWVVTNAFLKSNFEIIDFKEKLSYSDMINTPDHRRHQQQQHPRLYSSITQPQLNPFLFQQSNYPQQVPNIFQTGQQNGGGQIPVFFLPTNGQQQPQLNADQLSKLIGQSTFAQFGSGRTPTNFPPPPPLPLYRQQPIFVNSDDTTNNEFNDPNSFQQQNLYSSLIDVIPEHLQAGGNKMIKTSDRSLKIVDDGDDDEQDGDDGDGGNLSILGRVLSSLPQLIAERTAADRQRQVEQLAQLNRAGG
jgi:hypothetical protein